MKIAMTMIGILIAGTAGAMGHHSRAVVGADGKIIEPKTVAAPEIDPGVGLGAVMLLVGSLAVIRGRRPS